MAQAQMTLFGNLATAVTKQQASRSGSFVDNMSLPVHRWFRYSAGFASQWVEQVLADWHVKADQVVLDPFAGSGTVAVTCDRQQIPSYSVEAHPLVARICKAKLLWRVPDHRLGRFAEAVLKQAKASPGLTPYPSLIHRSFSEDTLLVLHRLKVAWSTLNDESPESELVWLAIIAILRPSSKAGTAQWQYILPSKTKKKVVAPEILFYRQIESMKSDMRWMQASAQDSLATVIQGDARKLPDSLRGKVQAVITSPPYANNYDYADALRFEMSFWGEVDGWGDIHDKVRKHLIVSSSQHSSREKLKLDVLLRSDAVGPIRKELTQATEALAEVRGSHGGKKHYHTMIAAYFRDIALTIQQLRLVCGVGSHMCWVIGDSAPYGVYCPVERWIGELSLAAGFKSYRFEKLRDRNIKWKNRKHRVPLKEGLLWIEG